MDHEVQIAAVQSDIDTERSKKTKLETEQKMKQERLVIPEGRILQHSLLCQNNSL